MSMPVIETNIAGSGKLQKKKSLELAWDPLTGESLLDQVFAHLAELAEFWRLGVLSMQRIWPDWKYLRGVFVNIWDNNVKETESVDSGRESDVRKLSTSSTRFDLHHRHHSCEDEVNGADTVPLTARR